MGLSTLPIAGSTTKTWTIRSSGLSINSVTGNVTGISLGYPTTRIYYFNNTFVFGTGSGQIWYSTDSKTWRGQRIFPTSAQISAIAWNGTTWVIGGANNYLYTSTTLGGTWTARTSQLATTNAINDIVWVGGSINLFLLCGDGGTSGNTRISSSPDGITWTSRYAPTNTNNIMTFAVNTAQTTICSTGDRAVASEQGVFSTNGTSWTLMPVTVTTTQQFGSIFYMPHADKFVSWRTGWRRAPASVGTAWDTAVNEYQWKMTSAQSTIMQNNDAQVKKAFPIWDSANNRYYALSFANQNQYGPYLLNTYDNQDILNEYSTGSTNYYQFNQISSEPINIGANNSGGTASANDIPGFGYGAGIWVVATQGASSQSSGILIASTAT